MESFTTFFIISATRNKHWTEIRGWVLRWVYRIKQVGFGGMYLRVEVNDHIWDIPDNSGW